MLNEGPGKAVLGLLLLWLMLVLGVAAGMILGAWVLMMYLAQRLQEVSQSWQ